MAIKLGMEAALKYKTGGPGGGCVDGTRQHRDVTLNLEAGEADVTTRANSGWRATVATLKEASVEFEMVWDTGDAGFTAIKNAFFNNDPSASRSSTRPRARACRRTSRSPTSAAARPSEEAITVSDVTAKVTAAFGDHAAVMDLSHGGTDAAVQGQRGSDLDGGHQRRHAQTRARAHRASTPCRSSRDAHREAHPRPRACCATWSTPSASPRPTPPQGLRRGVRQGDGGRRHRGRDGAVLDELISFCPSPRDRANLGRVLQATNRDDGQGPRPDGEADRDADQRRAGQAREPDGPPSPSRRRLEVHLPVPGLGLDPGP